MKHFTRFSSALCAVITVIVAITGCSAPYTPAPQILPANIKRIFIRPIVNNTPQYGLEDKFTLTLVDEFIRDGRLSVVNSEADADGILAVEINRYILQPLTYDANLVTQQYKLWILINVYLIDKNNNVTLWAEPNLEGIQIFQNGGRTEDEVREVIWNNLSRDVVKRTTSGFGSVSGASERKVSIPEAQQ